MGKRAADGGSKDSAWSFLENIDTELAAAVCALYANPLQFDGAFDTMDEAADMARDLLPHRPPGEIAAMARALGAWKQRGKLSPSFARQLSEGMDAQPSGVMKARPDPGAIYTSLVEGSPSIALEGLKKAIRMRRSAQAGREEREKEARERWGLELVSYIKEAELPCAERMQAMGGQNSQWLRLFGNRRSKTLRNRAMSWKGFRAWLQVARGEVWPSDVGCFLKYLEERHEVQPLGKTTPGALLVWPSDVGCFLKYLEERHEVQPLGKTTPGALLSSLSLLESAELEAGSLPPKQAPMYAVSIMLACELVVRKSSLPVGYRIMAFILLIMIWGTLRADDVQNIDPASLRLSGVGLRFTLGRTKTSGPGRRVGTLPGFISRTTGLSGLDWMSEGVRLLGTEAFGWSRDYLCPQFHADWDDCDREFMDAEGLALQVRRFLSELRTPFRHEGRWGLSRALLIPGPMVRYWTGHSGRHTLPSLAAALEVGKEKRDFLGRWAYSQHGSQDYVLTARQVVHGVQNHVCRTLLEGSAAGLEAWGNLPSLSGRPGK
eukprot:s4618_g6.t1